MIKIILYLLLTSSILCAEKINLYYSTMPTYPFFFEEENKIQGVYVDILEEISKKSNFIFKYVPSNNYSDMVNKFKNNEIDIVINFIDELNIDMQYYMSRTIFSYPLAIVSNKNSIINSLNDLKHLKVSVYKNSTFIDNIKDEYPLLKLHESKSIEHALSLTNSGYMDASIVHSEIALNFSYKQFKNIVLSDFTDFYYNHRFLIHPSKKEYIESLNLALINISRFYSFNTMKKWSKPHTHIHENEEFLVGFLFVLFFLFILFFWNRFLYKKVRKEKFIIEKLSQNVDDNIISATVDRNGKTLSVSNAFCEATGYSESDFLEKDVFFLRHPAFNNDSRASLEQSYVNVSEWEGEYMLLTSNGRTKWFYLKKTLDLDAHGHFLNYVIIAQDITAFKEVEFLNNEVIETQKELIFTVSEIAEARSKETGHHVQRVSEYSRLLGTFIGLPQKEIDYLKLASPMHDIGKMAIPESILHKPDKLTDDEFEYMKKHTAFGYDILSGSNKHIFKVASIVAREHHEKWDGTGYPRGLKGDEIHIYGRITALADVFDALGSKRSYKEAWSDEEIFKFLKEQSGKHFDPILIEIFFEHLDDFLRVREQFQS